MQALALKTQTPFLEGTLSHMKQDGFLYRSLADSRDQRQNAVRPPYSSSNTPGNTSESTCTSQSRSRRGAKPGLPSEAKGREERILCSGIQKAQKPCAAFPLLCLVHCALIQKKRSAPQLPN